MSSLKSRLSREELWQSESEKQGPEPVLTCVENGLVFLFVLILLTACAGPQKIITRTEVVEVPVPVIQQIPERRTMPLVVPLLPLGATNSDLAETLASCYDVLHAANADRAWIRRATSDR